MSIVAALDKVLFFNASSKYSVLRMKTEDSSVPAEARSPYRYHDHLIRFTAVGIELPQTDTVKIEMDGEWKDGKYGLQLQVDHWQEIVPPTLEGVRNYLASGLLKGIGEKTADAIIEKFGINALEILEHQPDRLLEIRGITKERLAEIKDAYAETSRMRVLMTLLAPFKVTPTTAQKIYQHFGPACADIVRQSPFNLCQVPGFGFKRIDAIVQKSGGDLRDPKRVHGALFYALEDARTKDGHLYLEAESLLKAAMQLLNERIPLPQMRVPMSQVEQELSAMIRQDEVVSNHGNVYLPKQFLQESETAQKAVELFLTKPTVVDIAQPLERVKHSLGLNLSKRQSEGVEMVFRHNLSIITGGPGTGKTTVLKTVIEVYRQLYPQQKIVLGAPTGTPCAVAANQIRRPLFAPLKAGVGKRGTQISQNPVVGIAEQQIIRYRLLKLRHRKGVLRDTLGMELAFPLLALTAALGLLHIGKQEDQHDPKPPEGEYPDQQPRLPGPAYQSHTRALTIGSLRCAAKNRK